jgi:anthraniloyl-CoA monooxygenase
VQVAVIGAGPAGLYLSLLLKKAVPAHDIVVLEKNPAGATYGWGVVFSDRTLSSFREADYKTYQQIIDRFIEWDAIDVRYRDEVVRCGGQGFSGIERKVLLELLRARAAELGVRMEFEREVSGPAELDSFDLVVAADGVRSVVRDAASETFRPRAALGRSRYIWFGTPHTLDSFTFAFRATEDGFFQAHAYPFNGTTSTFIVECSEETWKRAGLDTASEADSIAYCESLFERDLGGHELMSNQSKWINFVTIKNKRWHHGKVVLVGDAAHTAHFSIGSGTKLAMEDSIALANALATRDDLEDALTEYELERKPRVERFQEAARQSQTYFENTALYQHMEPLQFAFHLLSRSGRIDYDDLRVRDRHFVGAVDRWFLSQADAGASAALAPPAAFAPGRLGRLAVSNRVVLRSPEGLEAATRTGAGVAFTGFVAVSEHARITPETPGLYSDDQANEWKTAIAAARGDGGAAVAVTLGHSGPRGATRPRAHAADLPLASSEAWGLLAASEVPYTARSAVPMELDRKTMDDVVEDFVAATRRAHAAGFDMVEVHMAHGYLLATFLSPLTNKRSDEYGGALEGRLRFPLEVLDAVRAAWPDELPLGVVLNASDWASRGTTLADAVAAARVLKEHGCDVIRVVAGQTTARHTPRYDPYFLTHYADRIRNEARVATIATGDITTVDHVNTIVAGGRADYCELRPAGPRARTSSSP